VAIGIAALAALLVLRYLQSADDRAVGDAQVVAVWKIQADIPQGTTLDEAIAQDLITRDEIPQAFRPATAIPAPSDTDLAAVAADDLSKVAVIDLPQGSVLISGLFVDARTAQVTSARRIDSGRVAVTVSIDQIRGVANLPLPGDRVNIVTRVRDISVPIPEGFDESVQDTIVVPYQNVKILFVGQTAAPEVGESTSVTLPAGGSNLITFEVPPEAASRIIAIANSEFGMWLTLVRPDDYQPVIIQGVNGFQLLEGGFTPDYLESRSEPAPASATPAG